MLSIIFEICLSEKFTSIPAYSKYTYNLLKSFFFNSRKYSLNFFIRRLSDSENLFLSFSIIKFAINFNPFGIGICSYSIIFLAVPLFFIGV